MPELVAPTLRLQAAWREAHEEWGPGAHEDGFGLLASESVAFVGRASDTVRAASATATTKETGDTP